MEHVQGGYDPLASTESERNLNMPDLHKETVRLMETNNGENVEIEDGEISPQETSPEWSKPRQTSTPIHPDRYDYRYEQLPPVNDYWWPASTWTPQNPAPLAPWPTNSGGPGRVQTSANLESIQSNRIAGDSNFSRYYDGKGSNPRGTQRQRFPVGGHSAARGGRGRGPLRSRGGGSSRGGNRCRAHHRMCCRRCGYVPVHIRSDQLLREIAARVQEYDGRTPTVNQLKNLLNNATF